MHFVNGNECRRCIADLTYDRQLIVEETESVDTQIRRRVAAVLADGVQQEKAIVVKSMQRDFYFRLADSCKVLLRSTPSAVRCTLEIVTPTHN
ncbi:hypothetical protein C7S13_4714 [Burkholderia cepacia]|nr:hypothetical protein [Burkholderia cepacia]